MAKVGTESEQGRSLQIVGISGVNDNDVVIEAVGIERFTEFTIGSTAGVMDVEISLDDTNFLTAKLSLADLGATVTNPVLQTVANRVYRFRGIFKSIRISQKDAAAVANPVLLCGKEK